MKKVLLNSQNSVEKPPVHGSIVNPNYLVWGYIYGEITDQKDLQAALDKLQEAIDKGGSGSVVDVKQLDVPGSEYLTTYYLTQGGFPVGVNINIPKDFLLTSVLLKTVETNNEAYEGSEIGDKYIDFIINTRDNSVEDEHIYLPVKELMDIYSADEKTLHLDTTTKIFSISKEYQDSVNKSFKELSDNLTKETNRATQAESTLKTSLETETSERKSADEKLQTNINAEETRATTVEGNLSNLTTASKDNLVSAINSEVNQRESDVSNLTTNLQNEVERAKAEEDELSNALSTETTNRTNADTTLQSNIDTEATNRETADTKLGERIDTVEDTYLPLTGGKLTGAVIAPSFQTGTSESAYFQTKKMRGQGNANAYQHAVDWGYQGHNQVDFYEYGAIWNFYESKTGQTPILVGSIKSTGWNGGAVLTGTPTAPTAAEGTNTTQIATTEFVTNAVTKESDSITSYVDTNFSLISETGYRIDLEINSTTYELQAKLYDKNDKLISESTIIDLPIESSVVKIDFNKDTNTLTFTLRNGTTTEVPLSSIITGLATETYVDNKITAEATTRKSADDTLTANLNTEISDRKSDIATEKTARESADTTLTNNLNSEIERAKTVENLKEDKSNLKDFAYASLGAGVVTSKTISGIKASGNVTGTASVTLKQTSTNATLTKSDYTPTGSITGTALSNTTLSDPVTDLFAKSGITVDVEDEILSFTIAPTGSAVTKQGTLTNTQATLGFTGNKTSVVSGVAYDKASVNDATISIGQVSLDVGDIVVPSQTVIVSPGEDPIDASEVKY